MALKKGTWSPEEDRKLTEYIKRHGIWNWRKMPEPAGLLRTGKSCRLRWVNYLSPNVKRGNFTYEEDEAITRMHSVLGNKWSTIAAALPGRRDNEIKNHWHTHLHKRARKPVLKQPKVTNTISDNTVDPSALAPSPLPKCSYVEPPIPPFPYILDSSAETSHHTTFFETSGSEQGTEASLVVPNYFGENLFLENHHQALDKSSGFEPTYGEFWDPGPISPFGSYSSSFTTCYNPWSDVAVADDMDGVFIDPIFQF